MRLYCVSALLWLVCAGWVEAQGRVSPAGSLQEVRQDHTATVLRDGRVLVVGGRAADGLTTLASCEVYEPKKNRWARCAPLRVARAHHAAVLLSDGRVLVTGGSTFQSSEEMNRFVSLSSAEIYTPSQNAWAAVTPMKDARAGHTATLLRDGSVLVVGGALLTSVEQFKPETGVWSAQAPMPIGRSLHAALRLANGDVVTVGGKSPQGVPLAQVDRFNIRSGEWQSLPAMSEARQHSAVLVDTAGETVLVIGGHTGTSPTNAVETWNASGWTPFENHLAVPLASHTGTWLPGGDVLVVGGEPSDSVDTKRIQRWVKTLNRWCLAGELRTSRKQHTASLLSDGRVLVVGGTSGGLPERTAELWAPIQGKCEEPSGIAFLE